MLILILQVWVILCQMTFKVHTWHYRAFNYNDMQPFCSHMQISCSTQILVAGKATVKFHKGTEIKRAHMVN